MQKMHQHLRCITHHLRCITNFGASPPSVHHYFNDLVEVSDIIVTKHSRLVLARNKGKHVFQERSFGPLYKLLVGGEEGPDLPWTLYYVIIYDHLTSPVSFTRTTRFTKITTFTGFTGITRFTGSTRFTRITIFTRFTGITRITSIFPNRYSNMWISHLRISKCNICIIRA